MTDWSSGYVADLGYTFGYYLELNPLRARHALINAGFVPPTMGTACELGFGQGISANVHAAASAGQWFGTDFNPAQTGFAQELANASVAGVHLFDQSFAEFCGRTDLPEFDFIGLHGIWSWISDENRTVVVDFVRRKLKVGGVFYVSYNTQPGWATMVPLRDLLTDHATMMGAPGLGIVSRIDGALAFAEKLFATNPLYLQANAQAGERLQRIKGQDRHYVAHEYFNRDWQPMSFARMTQWLEPAKLNFVCSAHYLDALDGLNLSVEQQALIKEIPDTTFRETVRDFMVNQQFRRDYWVRGPRKLNPLEQAEALRKQRILLARRRPDVSLKINGALGEATLQEQVYAPILDALADHQPKTLGQIEHEVQNKGIVFAQIKEAAMVLAGVSTLALVQDDPTITKARKQTEKLNTFLCNKARGGNDNSFLASPVTGGGVSMDRFQQLFLLARTQGKKQPLEWAQFVWQLLAAQGKKIIKEGKALETADDNLLELHKQAQSFAENQVPILKALGIA